MSQAGFWYQIQTRFSPALSKINNFNLLNYFFGTGLGDPFYIPWFEYREELNPYNINVDSFYLTMFAKFGFFSLFLLYRFSYFFCVSKKKVVYSIDKFIFLMFVFSATLYQIYAVGIVAGYLLVKNNETNSRQGNT